MFEELKPVLPIYIPRERCTSPPVQFLKFYNNKKKNKKNNNTKNK